MKRKTKESINSRTNPHSTIDRSGPDGDVWRLLSYLQQSLRHPIILFLCDSLKFSFGKGSKGEGPEDFTSPWLYNSFDQHLYVRGYSKANVTVAFGIADKDYTPVKRYLQTNALLGLNFGTVLSNDILVGYKHDADIAIWIYDLARDTLLQRTTLELNEHIKEDFYQENRGMTAATAQGTIAYAYRYKTKSTSSD